MGQETSVVHPVQMQEQLYFSQTTQHPFTLTEMPRWVGRSWISMDLLEDALSFDGGHQHKQGPAQCHTWRYSTWCPPWHACSHKLTKQPIHKVRILAKGCRRDATTCFNHTFQHCMGKGWMLEVELLVLTYAAFLHLLQWANWVKLLMLN